jgi:hypothetical protein
MPRLAVAEAASTGSPAKTRRAFMRASVASVASVSILAPSIVSASVAEPAASAPDPIFAAIERYQRASAGSDRLCDLADAGEVVDCEASTEEILASRLNLASTAPTTLLGLAAYARFLDHQSSVVFGEGFFDEELNGRAEQHAFFASLNRSLAGLQRAAADFTADGDAELLQLGASLDLAIGAAEIARRDLNAAEAKHEAHKPLPSDAMRRRDGDEIFPIQFDLVDGFYTSADIGKLRRRQAKGWENFFDAVPRRMRGMFNAEDWMRRARERADEIIGAADAYTAARREQATSLGLARLDTQYDARLDDLDRLWQSIANIRATTIEGLAVKARLAQFHLNRGRGLAPLEFAGDDHEIGCNICDDLVELTAVEKAAPHFAGPETVA